MTGKVLCYTTAFDLGGSTDFQQQARLFAASLQYSGFKGDIRIIHNGSKNIFRNPRPNVEEIRVNTPQDKKACYTIKYEARHLLDVGKYDWVMFFDADCIIRTPLDHWFTGPEVIRHVQETRMPIQRSQFSSYLTEDEMENLEHPGYNSGTFVVRADHFQEVMALWETIDQSPPLREKPCWDQAAWNRLLLDTKHATKPLVFPSVDFFYNKRDIMELLDSPLLHFCGAGREEKLRGMEAKFLSNFHNDQDGSLIAALER